MKVWINNKMIDAKDAKVSIFDRGFLYGDGLFETMRCYDGKIFKLAEHISRLFRSSKVMKIKIRNSKAKFAKTIYRILKANRLKDAYVRLTITRGEGSFALIRGKDAKPNVIITAKKFKGYPEAFYSRGISAKISDIRQDERSALSKIKSLNFLNHILARIRAQDDGFDEAILMNTKGHIAEAATSNIFLVKNGSILTPSLTSGILPGITRGSVIHIARKLGMRVTEKSVSSKELINADEVFLTNSLAELLSVIKINRIRIGDGKPGKVTKLLHAAYREMV